MLTQKISSGLRPQASGLVIQPESSLELKLQYPGPPPLNDAKWVALWTNEFEGLHKMELLIFLYQQSTSRCVPWEHLTWKWASIIRRCQCTLYKYNCTPLLVPSYELMILHPFKEGELTLKLSLLSEWDSEDLWSDTALASSMSLTHPGFYLCLTKSAPNRWR